MAGMVFLLFLLSETATVHLQESAGLYAVTGLKYIDDLYYVSDMTQLLVFDHDGRFVKRLVRRGQGPHEMNVILNMVKAPEGIWIAGPGKALQIKQGKVADIIRAEGLLRGQYQDDLIFSVFNRTKKDVQRILVKNVATKQKRFFMSASPEDTKNHHKFNNIAICQWENFVAFGDGMSNRFYLLDLITEEQTELKPDLSQIVSYDIKKHGTISPRTSRKQFNEFVSTFDSLSGPTHSFFVTHKGHPYVLFSWTLKRQNSAHIQLLDMAGQSLGRANVKLAPYDQDEDENLLFFKRLEGTEDYGVERLPIAVLFGGK